MFSRYDSLVRSQNEESNFWPSFTDLLSSILIFILIFMLIINAVKTSEINDQAEHLKELQRQIDYVRGMSGEISRNLHEEFKGTGLDLQVDVETGSINFSADIYFDTSSDVLNPRFRQELNQFVPQYLSILLSDKYKEHVSEIVVEGHTDERGTYMNNLDLSQKRAHNVVQYILSDKFEYIPNKEYLKQIVTANGKSWSQLIYNGDGSINQAESRRVEFRFRLKEYEELEEILKYKIFNKNY